MAIKKTILERKNEDIDNAVYNWIVAARNDNKAISGDAIINKAMSISKSMGYVDFNVTRGWLSCFKNRFGLRSKKLHGEASNVDVSSIYSWQQENQHILNKYDPQNIINVDETALFYQQVNRRSYVLKSEREVRGCKASKKRVTVLVSVAYDGSKLPLFVIGKHKKPQCFKNFRNLPLDHFSQQIFLAECLNILPNNETIRYKVFKRE